MHELSTCKSLIQQIENTISNYAECNIKSITVLIGELARVDIDELAELFPLASKGTIAENAELIIKRDAVKYSCNECQKITTGTGSDLYCKFCHSSQLTLVSGTEMVLENIEIIQA